MAWGEKTLGHTEILNLNQSGRTRMSPSMHPPLSLSRPFSFRVPPLTPPPVHSGKIQELFSGSVPSPFTSFLWFRNLLPTLPPLQSTPLFILRGDGDSQLGPHCEVCMDSNSNVPGRPIHGPYDIAGDDSEPWTAVSAPFFHRGSAPLVETSRTQPIRNSRHREEQY